MELEKIKYGYTFDDKGTPTFVDLRVSYIQPCDMTDEVQEISIEMGDVGGGPYFVIKTNRWAFDDVDDLIKILNDFKRKVDL